MELKPIFRKLFGTDTKAVRIPMKPGDNKEHFVQFKLENSFQFLDFLSLRLAETDAYRLFRADYGVVAGRVIGNEGVGIPNCRISLFLPRVAIDVSDDNRLDRSALEQQLIAGMYPFDTVTDEDSQGRRYNLLPSAPRNRGFNGFPENNLGIGATPKVPVGTFSEKEDILTNPSLLSVYSKYYRYTTTTNDAGDFMMFGVPTGTHTIHMDCDLTDIGRWSLSPILMNQVLGYPKDLFDNNGTAILPSTDLSILPNIQSQNISVLVKPLWSQEPDQGNIIGITRQDFKITAHIKPFVTVFGSNLTMNKNKWWGDRVIIRFHIGWKNLCLGFGPDREKVECRFHLKFKFGLRFGIRIKHLFDIGNPDGNGLTFKFNPTLDIQFPNILPFVAFEVGSNYCRLTGGKYDSSAIDIINHGNTCKCSVDGALEQIPDDGISDGLMLSSHRADTLKFMVFNLKPEAISDDRALVLKQEIDIFVNTRLPDPVELNFDNVQNGGPRTYTPFDSSVFSTIDERSDLKVLADSDYVKLVEPGQWVLQIPTNRRLMITAEDGRLVESPDKYKGVYTEFRGSMMVTSDDSIDNPVTQNRVGRIALRIPQRFDYTHNPKVWMLDHDLFLAGEIYSVAQKYATANAQFNSTEEEENSLYGSFASSALGWDNQTGLIMDVDYEGTPMASQATVIGMPTNHLTYVGDEYDYTSPTVNGDTSNNGTGPGQSDNLASQTFGEESATNVYDGVALPTVYTEAGFKLSVIPFYDMNDNFRGRINDALQNDQQLHFQSWCHQAFKNYTSNFTNPGFALQHTKNGGPNVFKIEYQGTVTDSLKFTLEGHWPTFTPEKFYTLDTNIHMVPFNMWETQDYHEEVTSITYFMWYGGIHYDLLTPVPTNGSLTANWRVYNQANPQEFGVTGFLPHENL